jgi:hypothetical protein
MMLGSGLKEKIRWLAGVSPRLLASSACSFVLLECLNRVAAAVGCGSCGHCGGGPASHRGGPCRPLGAGEHPSVRSARFLPFRWRPDQLLGRSDFDPAPNSTDPSLSYSDHAAISPPRPWRRARPEEKMSTVCSAIVSAAFVSDWMNDRRRVIWVALQIGSAFWLFLFLLALSHGGPPVAFFSFSPFFLFFSSYAFY